MLTSEELLRRRVKIADDYPNSPYKVGDIFSLTKDDMGRNQWVNQKGEYTYRMDIFDKYPKIFQPLPWYADRKPEDMPEYVKDEEGCCYKVQEWHTDIAPKATVFIDTKIHKGYIDGCTECPIYCDLFPATEAEYLTYKNKNNGK